MKRIALIVFAMAVVAIANAQIESDWAAKMKEAHDKTMQDYEQYRQQVFQDYENFRQQINADYARFMEEAWKPFSAQPKEEMPWQPKPPQPTVAAPDARPTTNPVPFEGRPLPPKPIEEQPQPVEPIKVPIRPFEKGEYVYFYGTPLLFHFDKSISKLHLNDVSEKSVSDIWLEMADPKYDNLIAECLQHRTEKDLCDWAYIMLTEMVAEKCCGGHTNEAVALHMYLLTQSGYQMRIGRADDRLCVLVGSDEKIYHYKYFMIDGVKYYNFDISLEDKPFCIFDHAFPNEKTMSLRMRQPKLAVELTEPRTIVSRRFPDVKATIELNKNLIDFYNGYPLSANWPYYSETSLSETLKECLYPVLRKAIEGKSQSEAANILINFVQTGFAYATDQEQFGYERPLFPDETFYYPFCDCEDRAILYSCLVRELLGMNAVLLNYPSHLATAVQFSEDVTGDYLNIEDVKYVICDPTYIGASIGMCMPDLKTVTPKVERVR